LLLLLLLVIAFFFPVDVAISIPYMHILPRSSIGSCYVMLPAEPCRLAPKFIGGNTMAPLQEQIQSINERLRAFGIEAIHEINQVDRQGR